MTSRVLVAGATGAIGAEVVRLLKADGHWVRTLSRDPKRAERLRGLADDVRVADAARGMVEHARDVDVVISALGGSVALNLGERRSYRAIDLMGNVRLLEAAVSSGVSRFVYVGVHTKPGYVHTHYVAAHEAFAGRLEASGIDFTVVRPTGVFSALTPLLDMARKGPLPMIGDGTARTNPVHPTCVAEACVRHLRSGPRDLSIGGPDVLTRKQILEMAAAACGKPARLRSMPPALFRGAGAVVRWLHPRLGELMQFVAAVSVVDAIAPSLGTRRLGEWFEQRARAPS